MEHLGSGQFGTVEKGVWKYPRGEEEVAIKLLQSGASDEDRVKFLQEAAIMGQFRHPNVVKLHGVVTLGDPVSLSLSLSLSLSQSLSLSLSLYHILILLFIYLYSFFPCQFV